MILAEIKEECKVVRVLIDNLEELAIIIKLIEEPLVINLCYHRQLRVRRVLRGDRLVQQVEG